MAHQISLVRSRPGGKSIMVETEHRIFRLLKWLPAGPTESGGHREKDLVQFIAEDGGTRTVAAEDLVHVR